MPVLHCPVLVLITIPTASFLVLASITCTVLEQRTEYSTVQY